VGCDLFIRDRAREVRFGGRFLRAWPVLVAPSNDA
jgi:hypothetical protein